MPKVTGKASLILDEEDQAKLTRLRERFPMSPIHPFTRLCFRLGLEQALTLDDATIIRLANGERLQPKLETADTERPPKPERRRKSLGIDALDELEAVAPSKPSELGIGDGAVRENPFETDTIPEQKEAS